MSLNRCDRNSCPEVQCNRLIMSYRYYLCDRCWAELLEYRQSWPARMTSQEILDRIRQFMLSAAGQYGVLEGARLEAEFLRIVDPCIPEES